MGGLGDPRQSQRGDCVTPEHPEKLAQAKKKKKKAATVGATQTTEQRQVIVRVETLKFLVN